MVGASKELAAARTALALVERELNETEDHVERMIVIRRLNLWRDHVAYWEAEEEPKAA